MQKKRAWITLLTVALAIIAVVGWLFYENRLDRSQQEALEALDRDAGQYDAQSIVLHNTSKARAQKLADLFGARLRITKDGSFATLTLPEGTTIRDIYAQKENRAYIEDMAADYQVQVSDLAEGERERLPGRPNYAVSDPDYALQGYLDYLNMGDVWGFYTGTGVTVAVIDTGIDTDHPEFAGRISEYSYNATQDKTVKDYNDWSLIEDTQGHGTAVAGVIAAAMNGSGTVGIAPSVQILVIKAECDANGTFKRTSDLVFGLYYAVERDVQVVNMSFGTYDPSNPFADATQLAVDSDIICVAAAGNDATSAICWPAADENVIGVGALGDAWELADYSNYGENTDLVAPGTTYTTQMGGSYGNSTGTSLASPVVAGILALMLEKYQYTTYDQVSEILYASCFDLGDLGRDWDYGFGAVDAYALIMEQQGKIRFDMMTDEVEDVEKVFIQGHTLQEMPEPERLYAVFDGWYYDDTFTQEYNYYVDTFSGEVTLYAKWVNEEDGIPFTYVELDDGTIEIRSYTGHRRYITIPALINGKIVSSVGDFAFEDQSRLREVTLPAGIKHIGRYAFAGCNNLLSIQIPENVQQIDEYAFMDNTRLRTVAFAGSSKLNSIGSYAFANSGLDRIELPASLISVDGSAFSGAVNLYEIKVQPGNAMFQSVDGVLLSKDGTTLVAYPAAKGISYTIPGGVSKIGILAFSYTRLKSVDLGSVQEIHEFAFAFSGLESVSVPDSVRFMGASVFAGSEKLARVTIGSGLNQISNGTFSRCGALTTIQIPANIQTIGISAFADSGLQQVTFGAGSNLQEIGPDAFNNCQISEIDIPASVVTIGDGAFSGLFVGNPLVRINFGSNSTLRTIGSQAFAKCWRLQQIDLPGSLQSIGEQAFFGTDLHAVTVPAGVKELGNGAFADCQSLQAITIAPGNAYYHDIYGVVYNTDNTMIHAYPAGKTESVYALEGTTQIVAPYSFTGVTSLNEVLLPEGLTQLSEYAFYSCGGLQNIHIPDNVVQIGRYAFAENWNLSSITFGMGSKLPRIGYGAFAYCGIYDFSIPANVSAIAQDAFMGSKNLSYLYFETNSKLESVSAYMFKGCDNLVQVSFGPGSALKHIQAHGFDDMANLITVDFGDAKLENIDNFAFRFCKSLSWIDLPETVKSIGRYAFYGCGNLSNMTLPSAVEHIGSYAFLQTGDMELYLQSENLPVYLEENWDRDIKGYYTGVSEIKENGEYRYACLPSGGIAILKYMGNASRVDLNQVNLGGNIVTIGGSAFEGSSVTSVVLPETLTQIQAEAFRDSKLQSITVPANVTFIGREAFANTPIQTLVFAAGSKLSRIEQYAFENTENLKSVLLPSGLTELGTGVFQKSGLETVTFAPGIGLTEIPQKAFAETKLTAVALPDSVTLVNHNAFANVQTLKSVSFGNNSGIRLMSNAFYHTGLESLHIPANVTYIGEYCFVALPNLKQFSVDAANPNYTAVDGLLLTRDGRKLMAVPAGRTGSLTVPLSVEEIGFGAFEESRLSEVKFHENANILSFGYRAFFKAENITSITVPKSVVSIDYYAFAYCKNLQEVNFAPDNQLKGIYEGAFCGDNNLENILIPDTIVEISDWAFFGCSKIDQIPISKTSGLKGIYDYAFAYTGLSGAFTTPETLIDIGDYAFIGNQFTSLTIPETNKKDLMLGIGIFEECNQLTEITLPFVGASYEDEKISWFGYIFGAGSYKANNLYLPKSLRYVTIMDGLETLYEGAFYDVDTPEVLYLPDSVHILHPNVFVNTDSRFELNGQIELYENQDPSIHSMYFQYSNLWGHISLAPGIERIPAFLFDGCQSLRSITIPESVTSIEIAAFQGAGLTSVTIPKNVTILEDWAFNCQQLLQVINLSSLDIEPGSTAHGSVAMNALIVTDREGNVSYKEDGEQYLRTNDDFLFQKSGSEYVLTAYLGGKTTVRLPESINGKSYRIDRLQGANHVIVPGSIKVLNSSAFMETTDIRKVTLEEGITAIEYNAFYGSWVEEIVLPSTLKTIGNGAFQNCWRLEKANLPKNVKTIGDDVFKGCRVLELEMDAANPYFVEIDGIIYNKSVTQMIYASFELTEIVIPKTVTSFYLMDYSNLEKVSFEAGSKLTELRSNSFANCKKLKSITLPEGMTSLGAGAFQGCTMLQEITLPASLKTIEYNPFNDSGIHTVHISAGNQYFVIVDGVLYDKNMTRLISVLKGVSEVTIPASVTTIGDQAFAGCTGMIKVDFEVGSKLTEIPAHCFSYCTGLESVTLPEKLTKIGDWAFSRVATIYNRSNLSLSFGSEDHGQVALYAFRIIDKNGNVSYNVPDGATVTDDGFVFQLVEGQYRLISYVGGKDTVTLPLSINGEPYIIDRMTGVKNVVIPEGMTEIGNNAFWCCSSLESIVIPSSVIIIGSSAFQDCYGLQKIVIPDTVEHIGDHAFSGCVNLTDITIPDGVWIGDYAFERTGYTSDPQNWSDGYCYLGRNLLDLDEGMERVILRSDTMIACSSAFEGMYLLKYLDMGGLANANLWDCMNLETIIIHNPTDQSIAYYFENNEIPLTLKNIVLDCQMIRSPFLCSGVSGVTVFVTETEENTRWDDNFRGWNGENRVVYAGEWIWANFYSENGQILRSTPQRVSAIIRMPYVKVPEGDAECSYVFDGWDVDGDGKADSLPATSTVDLHAHALIRKVEKQYTIIFMDEETGTIYKQLSAPKGASLNAPPAPEKKDATFLGWGNYGPVIKVSGDMIIYAKWHYHSYECAVTAPDCEHRGYTTFTCTECGFQKQDVFVDALGHSYTNYVSDGNATCQTDGTKTAYCDHGCGMTDTIADPGSITDHHYGAWQVIKPATETEEGLKRRDCDHCDHYEEVVIPIQIGPERVTSDVYAVDESTISKIGAKTKASDLLAGLNEGDYVRIFQGETEVTGDTLIGTGMQVHLIVGEQVVQRLTVVVTGDTNGDGNITLTDMLAVKAHLLNKSKLEGACQSAGDTNGDGSISITDFIQIKAQLLGKGDIVPQSVKPAA